MGVRAVDTITAWVIVLIFPKTGAWVSPPDHRGARFSKNARGPS